MIKTNIEHPTAPASAETAPEIDELSLVVASEYMKSMSEVRPWLASGEISHKQALAEAVTNIEQPVSQAIEVLAHSPDVETIADLREALASHLPGIDRDNSLLVRVIDHIMRVRWTAQYCASNKIAHRLATQDERARNGIDLFIHNVPISIQIPTVARYYKNFGKQTSVLGPAVKITDSILDHQVSSPSLMSMFDYVKKQQKSAAAKSAREKPSGPEVKPAQLLPRIAPIIASKAIGLLQLDTTEPPYAYKTDMLNLSPESLALEIISDVFDDPQDHDPINSQTPQQTGQQIYESILAHHDTPLVVALKREVAQIFGYTKKPSQEDGLHQAERNLIEEANGKFTEAGLRDCLTYISEYPGFHMPDMTGTLASLNGVRVEISAANLLKKAGYAVTWATGKQDARGADLFIDGIPIDVKSSSVDARRAASKEIEKTQADRIPSIRFVPPFTRESFQGQLLVPDDEITKLAANPALRRQVDKALTNYRQLFGKHIGYDDGPSDSQPARRLMPS